MAKVSPLFGLLPVVKPAGPTSRGALNRLQRILGQRKMGHTGTLDPFASGVLLVLLGGATRLNQYLSGMAKTYRARLLLGEETSTLDTEGEVTATAPVPPLTHEAAATALAVFVGDYRHEVPAFSAVHVGGERLYDLARKGEAPEALPQRTTHISRASLIAVEEKALVFEATVSTGTYIRSLGRDLAQSLGTVGHLTALERTQVGPFAIEDAIALCDLETLDNRDDLAHTCESNCVESLPFPKQTLSDKEAWRVRNGQRLPIEKQHTDTEYVTLTDGLGRFIGIGQVTANPDRPGFRLQPKIIFQDAAR